MDTYRIYTDATCDVDIAMPGLEDVTILPMSVQIGENTYRYGPSGNLEPDAFYRTLRQGHFASTSLITPAIYIDVFEESLSKGQDVIYFSLTSGLSSTLEAAHLAANALKDKYPTRKIIIQETFAASVGLGLLVREAAKEQKKGKSIEELATWTENFRLNICHWFLVDTFEHLHHGGRVSSLAATVGSVLQIKPMLRVNEEGKLIVMSKPRGTNHALKMLFQKLTEGWQPEASEHIIIGHGDNLATAEKLAKMVNKTYPQATIEMAQIGPVIGSHTGPGMVAISYWGTNRE